MNFATADPSHKPTILIVDDMPVNLGVVVENLESRGYHLLIAQDGAEGLKRAAFVKPDLILLDVMMPGWDGFETCRRLKGDTDTADIPVIFMTALAEAKHKITGFEAGGVDYVTKPIQIDEVIARVDTHLSLRTMQRQLQAQNLQLQKHQAELEQEVVRRTAELNIGNRLLREEVEERKRMETKILQREQEFRVLVENSPDPIFRIDSDCQCTYVNPAMERLTEQPAAQLINKLASSRLMVSTNGAGILMQTIREVLDTGQTAENEVEFRTPDGRLHYFHNRYAPEFGEHGNIVGVISISRDITERKLAENLLYQREREFRTLAEGLPDPICRYNRELQRTYVNPAWVKANSISVADALGKTLDETSPRISPLATKYRNIVKQVLASGEPVIWEMVLDKLDPVQYHLVKFVPEYDSNGNISGVLIISRDVSDLRRSEIAIRQREQEARTLVDNLPTVVVRYDRQFRRIYANPAYSTLTGFDSSEIPGNSLKDSWRATNISAEAYTAILADVMRSGRKTGVSLEWRDDDGRLVSHEMKIVPEYNINGKIDSVLTLGFDLSDRRQQQILESNRQRVFEKMAHGDNLNSILEQVALYVQSSRSGRYCGILLLDEECEHLQMAVVPSFPKSYRAKLNRQPLREENGRCYGWVASALRGKRVIVKDMVKHPCQSLCQAFIREIGAAACWSEPIFSSSGQLLGVVTLYLNQRGTPDEADLALLQQAGHLSSIAIERKRIEQQMYRQASYDQLTELPNRRLFGNRLREEIAKAERNSASLAVLFVDLDRFKEVNDTLGHETGDDLLVEAARRIRLCVRESDTVARLGGDEFMVILPNVEEIVPQDRVAQSILEAMARPFSLGEHNAYVSASVGIASYPQDADNAEALIGCADQAMYAAKGMGRNCFSFFNHNMLEQSRQRLELIGELRGALAAGQLEVYYQPIIDVAGGKAVKAEALLRWHHPELGMVPPDRFIPIAEETGLIQEIGAWVFREAADTARRWHDLNREDSAPQISVNMSPRQFIKDSGVQALIDYLQTINLAPSYLVVEITEGLLLDDSMAITEKLELLRKAGIQLSLDDFGTGYSAMAYLKKFNIDYLKIDRSFVRDLETDPGDRAIAEAIVVMAHRLGLKVIAEGVETEGQLALLAEAGCEYVQGYLYAKPMPVEAFLQYVGG